MQSQRPAHFDERLTALAMRSGSGEGPGSTEPTVVWSLTNMPVKLTVFFDGKTLETRTDLLRVRSHV
jgi:hypothetical protein